LLTVLVEFTVLAAAVSAASMTISKGKIFRPLRQKISAESFIGELIRCPYCTSHWLALAGVLWFKPALFLKNDSIISSFLVPWLALVAVAAPFSWIIYRAYSGPEEDA